MTKLGSRRRLAFLLSVLAFLVTVQLALLLVPRFGSAAGQLTPERAEELGVAYLPSGYEERISEYSHIRVEELGMMRTLFFVSEDGSKAIESRMNVARPQDLLVHYTRTLFASYLFEPHPERVLIVGLGGGSMVRFLQHYEPQLEVDVVDIDPMVIDVARDLFGTRPSPTVRIFARDAFDFFADTTTTYDVIYMDVFLEPSEEGTDASGTPLRLKTRAFLRQLRDRVHADGVVAFNVHHLEDVEVIADVFAQTYVFGLGVPGYVAVGTSSGERLSSEELSERAHDLDTRFQTSFSFVDMVKRLRRP